MDIDEIMDFIALSEARSFSKAAALRLVTQSAFSRRIQALENSLDTVLIDRSTNPVTLTPAGERFLVHAKSITEAVGKAKAEAKSQISALASPVYIAMPHALSLTFFPQWYKELRRKIPDLALRVTTDSTSQCVADLRKGVADFALILLAGSVATCFDFDGIEKTEIGSDRLIAVRSNRLDATATDLLAYPKDTYMHACLEKTLEGTAAGRTAFESPSAELLKAMAVAGFGIAVLQETMVQDDIADGFLVPVQAHALPCKVLLLRMAAKLNKPSENLWNAVVSR